MTSKVQHDLAVAYAQVKLSEYQVKRKTAPLEENTDFSIEEIQYLKSAYVFARNNLSE